MKKLFVLLLALVVVGSAMAQTTVSGYVRYTATMYGQEKIDGGETGLVTQAERLRIGIDNKDADGNWGFSARLQVSPTTGLKGATPVVTDKAFGWAKFLGGMGKATVGFIDIGDYNFGQNTSGNNLGNGNLGPDLGYNDEAIALQFYPMAGLNVGAIFKANGLALFDDAADSQFYFGAAYGVEKLLNVKANLKMLADSKLLGEAGAEFVGVENLSAVGGIKFDTAAEANTVFVIAEYTAGPIFVSGGVNYTLDPAAYYAEGNVEYSGEGYKVRGFLGMLDELDTFGYQFVDGKAAAAGPPVVLESRGDVNTMKFGAELTLPFSSKGELNVDVLYTDKGGIVLPVWVKVAF